MPNNRTYMRKFVILTGKKTPYSKDKNPKGHVKIEVRDGKGKINFNLEGLKPLGDNKLYKGYLVSNSKDTYLKAEVGPIDIKESGKGSFEGTFDPNSVYNTKHPIEDYEAILVKVSEIGKKDKEVIIPLGGFIEKSNNKLDDLIKSFYIDDDTTDPHIYNDGDDLAEESDDEVEELQEEIEEINVKEFDDDNLEEELEEEDLDKVDIYNQEIKEKEEELEEEDLEEEKVEELEEEELEKELKEVEDDELDSIDETKEEREEVEKSDGSYDADEILTMKDSFKDVSETEEIEKESLKEVEIDDKDEILQDDNKEVEDLEEIEDDFNDPDEESIEEGEYINIRGKEKEYFIDEGYEENFEERYEEEYDNFYEEPTPRQPIRNERPNRRVYNPISRAKNYSHQIYSYAANILKFFEEVKPFNKEFENYTWWEIEYDKNNLYRGFLPFYNYIIGMYYPHPLMYKTTTCQSLIRKYKNYLFGIHKENDEVKHYIYGIPGEFTREEQPYRGATGFTTWLSKKDDDKLGYWIIHIDAVTGKIVNPIKPTRPR